MSYVGNHPLQSAGLFLGGLSLTTGIGEVLIAGDIIDAGSSAETLETGLAGTSVASGAVATGIDLHYCGKRDSVSCIGAITGGAGFVGGGIAYLTDGALEAGATAIGLTSGAIGVIGDTADAAAEGFKRLDSASPLEFGCGR